MWLRQRRRRALGTELSGAKSDCNARGLVAMMTLGPFVVRFKARFGGGIR